MERIDTGKIFEILKYVIPALTFFFGLWWQNRTMEKSSKLATLRESMQFKRERDASVLFEIMRDVIAISSAAIDVVNRFRAWYDICVEMAQLQAGGEADEKPSKEAYLEALKKYRKVEERFDEVQASLLMLKMDECADNLKEVTEIIDLMFWDYGEESDSYDFQKPWARCMDLKDSMKERLVARYEQLCSASEESNNEKKNAQS